MDASEIQPSRSRPARVGDRRSTWLGRAKGSRSTQCRCLNPGAGGTVWYDWVSVGACGDNPSSEWLVERAGVDYFVNVFMHLTKLSRLQNLSLKNTDVSDAGLEHLIRIRFLNSLNLGGTKVTDDGLTQLTTGLTNLSRLILDDTKIGDV